MAMEFVESAIAIFLATIAPTIALTSVNLDFFSKRQMRNSLLLMAGTGIAFASLFFFVTDRYLYPFLTASINTPLPLIEAFACAISLTIFFLLSERTFNELITKKRTRLYTLIFVSIFFIAASYIISILFLDLILALYVTTSSIDFRKNLKTKRISDNNFSEEIKEQTENTIQFKNKPNVYVLFLESFHSTEALNELYGIDNTELCNSLSDKNFTLYKDIYSNRQNTVHSFTSMVCPNYLYNPDALTSSSQRSQSKVFSTFANNGYCLNLISDDFLKVRFSNQFHNYESESSSLGVCMHQMFAPILAQSALLRNMMSTKDFFESTPHFEKLFNELQSRMINDTTRPQLHWFHFGACHSDYYPWDKLEGFEDKYRKAYLTAEKELKKTVTMIKDLDPDPLIIAIGDHGAHRYRYIEAKEGNDPNKIIRSHDQEPDVIAKDYFSVFLGIHWPFAHYTAGEVLSHVRIFDHVFAALCEDKSLLKDLMPNVSIAAVREYGQAIAARDGKPLKEWVPVSKNNQLSFLVKETQKNPHDVSVHLCLAAKYYEVGERDRGDAYSLSLCKKFPTSEVTHTEAAKRMLAKKDIQTAEKLARTALAINPTSGAAYYCLALIADQKDLIAEHDESIQKTFQYDNSYIFVRDAYLRYGSVLLRQGRHEDLYNFFKDLDGLGKVHLQHFIDWQMLYRSYVTEKNNEVFEWADNNIDNAMSQDIKLAMSVKKIILCMQKKDWETAAETARNILKIKKNYPGAYIVLGHCLEKTGNLDEALQTFLSGAQVSKNETLLEQLGAFANRHNIRHPSLAQLKVTARELMKEKSSYLQNAISFDAKWYANEYKELLGGLSPFDHYMHYSSALMLNPNKDFDTAYYYSNHTEVFEHGVDASLHYTQCGRFDELRPRMTCLFDPSIAVNTKWKSDRTQ